MLSAVQPQDCVSFTTRRGRYCIDFESLPQTVASETCTSVGVYTVISIYFK